jgi:uncharacterized protein YciI
MLYVIIGVDGPEAKTLRPRLRAAHLDHLQALDARGRIILAGPLTDGHGSLIVVSAPSQEEAQSIAHTDPYLRGGVFARVEVHPFKQVFPAELPPAA